MSKLGILTAKPPVSPHANLTAVERVGTSKSEDSIWRVVCTCGAYFAAVGHGFRVGQTKCPRCQPSIGDVQAMEILMLLPATLDALTKKLELNAATLKSRVRAMKKNNLCHTGKWRHPRDMGSFQPLIVAGPGEDAPCTLTARTNADHKRKYRKRVKQAIETALNGGKENPRYARHIALSKAGATVKRARQEPQTPWSTLFAVAGQGERHA